MFIQTEATPNPATLKFLPGRPVLESGTLDIRSRDDAVQSPLAIRLFDVANVGAVGRRVGIAGPVERAIEPRVR